MISIILIALVIALAVCAAKAYASKKRVAHDVFLLIITLIMPIVGNLMIILSHEWLTSYIGCYFYYLGLDFATLALLRFTTNYCSIEYAGTFKRRLAVGVIAFDVVQMLLNIVFGHAFYITPTLVEGGVYYVMTPLIGQAIHRAIVYGIFFVSIGIFAYKTIKSPRIYAERYFVILAVMVFTGIWQTYYIFSRTPIDSSMIAFGVFGLLIFYFSLYYKPIRLLDRMLARVVSALDNMVVFFDADGTCIYANDVAMREFGIEDEEGLRDIGSKISEVINGPVPVDIEWTARRHIGVEPNDRYWILDCKHLTDGNGRRDGSVLGIRDATEDAKRLNRERKLATHDRLTGLYNKEHLYETARDMIDENVSVEFYAVALDVKDFKLINDIFSQELGDIVLKSIADKIREYATPGKVYGRISGDKFGYIVPVEEFDPVKIEAALNDNLSLRLGITHPVIIHMGVYKLQDPEIPVSVMFDRAFMAIATIKHDFQKHLAFYDANMREESIWGQSISAELDDAISTGQVRPYLQPLVDADGKVEGAEVLVRWVHPKEGILSPARFIPVFEANGMIAHLDRYMWECACKLLKDWSKRGIDLFLSVNISPKDFYFMDVYGTICSLVREYDIDPMKLRLEITETVMMSDLENRLRIIEDLRSQGFMVEMDDFGSGYSSLNMLKDIPVDVLKIDMMFLYKTKNQRKAETILQTIIDLSGNLGIPSITEGVETADQLNMLVSMGCRLFQGYYFAKPMPVEEFEEQYYAA